MAPLKPSCFSQKEVENARKLEPGKGLYPSTGNGGELDLEASQRILEKVGGTIRHRVNLRDANHLDSNKV